MFTLNVDSYNTYSSVSHEAKDPGLPLRHKVIPVAQATVQTPEKMHNCSRIQTFSSQHRDVYSLKIKRNQEQ